MEGFDPVDADELIIETTYGIPAYTFPEQEEIEADITDWLAANRETPLFLFGYSLGRAQKLQWLVQQRTDRDIVAHGAVHQMNQIIQNYTDLAFDAMPYRENKDVVGQEDAVFVLPSRLARSDWVNDRVSAVDGKTAGFSGWAVSEKFRHRGGYDVTFPLSDHCDFTELVELVRAVDPEQVYTHHGFDEAFAAFLRDEYGYSARPLKKNQASLSEF